MEKAVFESLKNTGPIVHRSPYRVSVDVVVAKICLTIMREKGFYLNRSGMWCTDPTNKKTLVLSCNNNWKAIPSY